MVCSLGVSIFDQLTRKQSPWRVNDAVSAANVICKIASTTLHTTLLIASSVTQDQLGLNNGVLFGVPIPEKYAAVGEQLQKAVEQAVKEADESGVSKMGKAVTPWLLNRVGELTQGRSLESSRCSLLPKRLLALMKALQTWP